jgi:hypothetical protein
MLVVAGDFWMNGIDNYAEAIAQLLEEPLPPDASEQARDHYRPLLGVLLVSLGYEVIGRDVRTRLFLRWIGNPRYDGPIILKWEPEPDGRFQLRIRPEGDPYPEAPHEDDEEPPEGKGFNRARFRLVGDFVETEGLIGNANPPASSERLTVWQYPPGYRLLVATDFDLGCETGFTAVTVYPDGRLVADPTVGAIDLHGVRFRTRERRNVASRLLDFVRALVRMS